MPIVRGTLSRELIVRTAIELADDVGLDRLTMRSVAAALGGEAMSLYGHVENKADLLEAMQDTLLAELLEATQQRMVPGESWDDTVRALTRSYLTMADRHIGAWRLYLLPVFPSTQGIKLIDLIFTSLESTPLDRVDLGQVFATLVSASFGAIAFELATSHALQRDAQTARNAHSAAAADERERFNRRASDIMKIERNARFDATIEAVISGLKVAHPCLDRSPASQA